MHLEFDFDVGEIMPGHRVRLRGIDRNEYGISVLNYEHHPGLDSTSPTPDWGLTFSDDLGTTTYAEDDGGGYDGHSGGEWTPGFRDIGIIPYGAHQLIVHVRPQPGWTPPEPWLREIVIPLHL